MAVVMPNDPLVCFLHQAKGQSIPQNGVFDTTREQQAYLDWHGKEKLEVFDWRTFYFFDFFTAFVIVVIILDRSGICSIILTNNLKKLVSPIILIERPANTMTANPTKAEKMARITVSVDENFMDPKERPEYRCRILGHSGH